MSPAPDVAVRRAEQADAEAVARLLRDFNTEFYSVDHALAAQTDSPGSRSEV